jgi:F-type H+-transporting ATPase subunit a
LYRLSKSIFGENNAIGAFRLLRMLFLLDIVILLIAFLTRRLLFDRPSKPQLIFEMVYNVFETFVTDTLGKQNAHFTPYILTIFIFVWVSNMIGMLPIPGVFEPTRNVNVPLGLGLMAVTFVHITAIKMKGAWSHLSQFINPIKNPMFILDIVGEFSKLVSMSFRLFGNILGGAIILLVISSLVNYIVMPVGLMLFFSLFVGTVQAFVFTMLALTYISVQILEE